MDPLTLAAIGFAVMLGLIALHVPIGVAMAVIGVAGFGIMVDWGPALSLLASEPAATLTNLDLAVLPLFMLMGSLAAAAGLAGDVYNIAQAWIGHRKGGLATATILGSGGFGAVCGSGVATTATFGKVALPEMLSRGYAPALATGSIAAGGTLGMIVPPSTVMVLYAVLTEQFVLDLFTAAIIPAIIAVLFYIAAVRVSVWRVGGQRSEPLPWPERFRALRRGWSVVFLATVVLGGIYSGIFTVNEAAAVGVVIAFVFVLVRRGFDPRMLIGVLGSGPIDHPLAA
ncbi:TRAP transporter large permease subunit [Paracoccus sp. PXZ]